MNIYFLKEFKMRVFIAITIGCLQTSSAKDIVVSLKGADTSDCGAVMKPCLTMNHSINIANPFDSLLIDNRNDQQSYNLMVYRTMNIQKELSMKPLQNKNVAIVSFMSTNENVLLFSLTSSFNISSIHFIFRDITDSLYMFEIEGNRKGILTLEHVSLVTYALFRGLSLFSILNSKWKINMWNCQIVILSINNTSKYTYIKPWNREAWNNKNNKNSYISTIKQDYTLTDTADISITDCHFNSFSSANQSFSIYVLANEIKKFSMEIFGTTLNGINTTFSKIYKIKIYNSRYKTSNIMLSEIYQTEIIDTSFSSSNITLSSSISHILMLNSTFVFMTVPLYIVNKENVEIKNCLFEYATRGVISIENSTVVFTKCTFRNNIKNFQNFTSKFSNFHFDENSNVTITYCSFINNSAAILPGDLNFPAGTIDGIIIKNQLIINETMIIGDALSQENIVINVKYGSSLQKLYIKNVNVSCPVSYIHNLNGLSSSAEYFSFTCTHCGKLQYNIQTSPVILSNNTIVHPDEDDFNVCLPCPYEAICDETIRSKGNYWGYVLETYSILRKVWFLYCPTSYCCSDSTTCISYNTCNVNRTGTLCGECRHGHSVSFFGNHHCIENVNCESVFYFWVTYGVFATFYFVIFMYLREFIYFFKNIIKSLLLRPTNQQEHYENIENEYRIEDTDEVLSTTFLLIPYHSVETQDYLNDSVMVSGMIKILFFFYQAASIIRINTSTKTGYDVPPIVDIVTSFFNIRIEVQSTKFNICPIINGTVVQVEFIKCGFVLICPLILLFLIIVCTKLKPTSPIVSNIIWYSTPIDSNTPSYVNLPFLTRMKCTYVQLLLMSFASLALFSFHAVKCVQIIDKKYLYMQASIECFTYWQVFIIAIIIVWVAPFCVSLYYGCHLLRHARITPNQFLLIVTFPPVVVWYLIQSNLGNVVGELYQPVAMEAKHLLRVVDEPFRKTLDGNGDINEGDKNVQWEPVLIFRRLLLVVISIFVLSPIEKLYPSGLLLLLYLIHHIISNPYKDARLNTAETISLTTLCFLNMSNIFWAFTEEIDISNSSILYPIGKILLYLELVILLSPFSLVISYILYMLSKKFIYKRCLCKQD